jgi:hypothetical protein
MSGNPQAKMKELVHLASSYDTEGIYTVCTEGICYEHVEKTDIIGISYLEIDTTNVQKLRDSNASKKDIDLAKHVIASQTTDGYTYYETNFEELGEMLKGDYAFTPFKLQNGTRGRDNLVGGCKWIYIDVDNSTISDQEAHFMLSHVNHHIVRTSNKNDPFKFRILVELDAMVELKNDQWKPFMTSVTDFLAIKADILPQSQIAFSYAGREVLSVTDAEPLEVKEHIMYATDIATEKELHRPKGKAAKDMLDNPFATFDYAFESADGNGSRNLIRAAYHAKDLGASKEEIIDLMHEINNYWLYPMPETRFNNTILSQIRRW